MSGTAAVSLKMERSLDLPCISRSASRFWRALRLPTNVIDHHRRTSLRAARRQTLSQHYKFTVYQLLLMLAMSCYDVGGCTMKFYKSRCTSNLKTSFVNRQDTHNCLLSYARFGAMEIPKVLPRLLFTASLMVVIVSPWSSP